MSRRILLAVVAILSWIPTPVAVAQSGDPVLDAVGASLDAGQVEEARAALEGWFPNQEDRASPHDVARARYYRARATADADSAEVDYLWVAVSSDDDYAPLARLRLAQMHLAAGDNRRALSDMETLRADFPGSVIVPVSWIWTGVARSETGDRDGACEAWREAESAVEAAESASGAFSSSTGREGDLDAVGDLAAIARMGCDPDGPESMAFTVQLGAFRDRSPAEDLWRRVVATGTEARVEAPASADGWYRVRAGQFGDRATAAGLAVRLRERGFEAIVVPTDS